jgi:hypothetical protein
VIGGTPPLIAFAHGVINMAFVYQVARKFVIGDEGTVLRIVRVNFTGVFLGSESELAKIAAGKGKAIDGHAPGLRGKNLNAYVLAGEEWQELFKISCGRAFPQKDVHSKTQFFTRLLHLNRFVIIQGGWLLARRIIRISGRPWGLRAWRGARAGKQQSNRPRSLLQRKRQSEEGRRLAGRGSGWRLRVFRRTQGVLR